MTRAIAERARHKPGTRVALRLVVCALLVAPLLVAARIAPSASAAQPGLVAAYGFDEGSGTTVNDQSGSGNNGTAANATWAATGKYGKALQFNGTNSLVTIPDAAALHLTTGMTLEAWVNPSTVNGNWRDVVYKGNDNYYLEATSTNASKPDAGLIAGGSYGDAYGTAALPANTWSYLAETYDGTTLRLYVNGTQVASTAHTGAIATSTNPLQIGGDSLYGQNFAGMIDEVRVYNTALTAAQIQTDQTTPITPTGPDTTPPTGPTTLTATAVSGTEIDLSWPAATDNVGVTGYQVERCQGAGCSNFAQIATPTATSYKDTTLTAGVSYSYRVRATDAAGNLGSYTPNATATTPAPDTQPPTGPTTLTANAISGSEVDLAWPAATDNVGVTGYLVERCSGSACSNFAQVATPTATSYKDTAVSAGTSYSYRVRATDAAGNLGSYTPTAIATTPTPDTQPPTGPTSLTATAISAGEIDLSWPAASDNVGVTGYRVERCQGTNCSSFAQVATPTATSYKDTTVSAGTSYSYRVRATDAAGNLGSYTPTATATTPAAPSGLVAAYGFDAGSGTAIADQSGTGNNGTAANTTWAATGKFGKALQFNSTNSLVTIPDAASLHLTTGMTLEAWVNPSTVNANWRDVVYKGNDNYYLEATSSNGSKPDAGLIAGGSYADAYGTAALPANAWSYLAETYDGSTVRLYLNGTQVGSVAHTGAITTSTNPLQIGGDSIYGQHFVGLIDEVRVYNTARTAAQIQADQTTPITPTGPDTTPPTGPASLTATAVSTGEIDLSWPAATDNVGVTGYLVERCQGASCSGFAQIATPTATSYKDTAVNAGTAYSYRVRATDAAGNLGSYTPIASATTPSAMYSVGGSVSGLSGSVVLRNNGGDDLSVSANGSFTFATKLADGSAYNVTVKTNPAGQTCAVASGSGTVSGGNVTGVAVTCTTTPTYSVGGSVSGLSGTVVLRNNGGDDLSVSANGPFTFATKLADGSAYAVTVKTNPTGQTCAVASGSGTVSGGNVTGVAVTCTTTPTYSVGGSVSGLSGTVVLQDNGSDDLSVNANGSFTFATKLVDGSAYSVTVKTNPTGQTCTVSGGSGSLAGANVTGVAVACATSTTPTDNFNRADGPLGANWSAVTDGALTISGQAVVGASGTAGDIRVGETYAGDQSSQVEVTSTQLSGGQWIGPAVRMQNGGQDMYLGIYFWNNGVQQLRLYKRNAGNWIQLGNSANSSPLAAGTQLKLTVVGSTISFLQNGVAQITATDTSVTGGAPGIMTFGTAFADNWVGGGAGSPAPTYSIGGSVTGSSGTLVLQDNGGDDLSLNANGLFSFATKLANGSAYSVTVKSNPTGQTCTVSNGSGTVSGGNVTNVAVSCVATPSYSVGGNVTGLAGTVVLQDNGGDNLTVSANGAFTFATKLPDGSAYSVTVQSNPIGQSCGVASGSGTVSGANVTTVAVACSTNSTSSATDDFNRADGALGSNWAAVTDGALSISGQAVIGTSATAGAIRVGETYTGDQSSQVEVTSTQLSGGQWIGPAVRMQNGGQNMYLGIYFWNNGTQQLRLYERNAGTWIQLGGSYNCGALAAGTQLQLVAVGSQISFLQNGVTRITATDTTVTGGAPGIMTFGTAKGDNWVGANASATVNPKMQVQYTGTDGNGVASYNVVSSDNGYGTQVLRVLNPTNPAPGVAHNFLYLLPVEPGLGTQYGDGIDTLRSLNAQNQYNLTIVEPTFQFDSWYADNPTDPNIQYETFMTQDLVPWVRQNLSTTGHEQNWLIGFSKSGIGGEDLILKHPDVYSLVASWDFPADMGTYDQFGSSSANDYGTDANFQANYRLTQAFVDAHKTPFLTKNRIWIGGYSVFGTDMSDYDALLTSEGILHSTETPTVMTHRWDSGWVQIALVALEQDSVNLGP
jgi:fibronectin type 3 domain-containing protein/predicted transcriptional regulator